MMAIVRNEGAKLIFFMLWDANDRARLILGIISARFTQRKAASDEIDAQQSFVAVEFWKIVARITTAFLLVLFDSRDQAWIG